VKNEFDFDLENKEILNLNKKIEELEFKIEDKNKDVFQLKETIHELENKLRIVKGFFNLKIIGILKTMNSKMKTSKCKNIWSNTALQLKQLFRKARTSPTQPRIQILL
jgi:predicted  nucleic acid-binding Zn-ribbon protein